MAVISFPLGFKIVASSGSSNTGSPIDERQVFSSSSARSSYDNSFFYEGLFSYTVGDPYHGTGVTSDAGFYYRNSSNSWVGFNSDTVDDKHAQGTMDSSSNATSDPTTGTNIVDHVNYLYTITSSLGGSRTWKAPVTNFSDLATTYPTPSNGWSALVTSTNIIYTYNGSAWIATGANVPALSSSVDGIVSHTWYTTLNDLITNTSDYSNKDVFGFVVVQNGGSSVSGSPVTASTQQDSFTINVTGGLTASVSGNVITLNGGGSGGVTPTDNILKWDSTNKYYRIYTDKSEAGGAGSNGKIYGSTTSPTATDRANYDGYLYATKLFSGGVEVEKSIGNPSTDGYILSSTSTGTRSWVVTATDNLLNWDDTNRYYKPYSSQTIGSFDNSSSDPSHSNRLNYDGYLHATVYFTGVSSNVQSTLSSGGLTIIDSTSGGSTATFQRESIGFGGVLGSSYTGWCAMVPGVNDSSGAVTIYKFGTKNTLTHAGSKLVSFLNNSTEKFSVDKDGNINIPTGSNYKINNTNLQSSDIGAEPSLGNPSTNGYILSSTTSGVRSWISVSGAILPIIGDTQTNAIKLSTSTTHNSQGLLDLYTDSLVSGLYSLSSSSGTAILATSQSSGYAIQSHSTGSGSALHINNDASGAGIEIFSTSNGIPLFVQNSGSGNCIHIVDGSSANLFTVDNTGNVNIPTGSTYKINGVPIGAGSGTVTSIATSSPLSGGTITTTGTISITKADTSTDGYISSTDWNTFNGKQGAYTNLSSIGTLSDTNGWLHNNGSGTFSYSTPTYSDVGAQQSNSNLSSLAGLTYSSASFVKMTGANTFTLDTNSYLTSLSGAVLTDQTSGQTIGTTGARLTKLWATDITVTNTISGSVSGSSATSFGCTLDTDTTLAADSASRIPTQHAVKTYVDSHTATVDFTSDQNILAIQVFS